MVMVKTTTNEEFNIHVGCFFLEGFELRSNVFVALSCTPCCYSELLVRFFGFILF